MTAANYDQCLKRLLVHEGGYTNHPKDPGGPTNFGITIWDYRKYVKPDATAGDVRNMQLADAKAVYKTRYWGAPLIDCDSLPSGVDDSVFDYAVNSGVGRAGKVLRRVVGLPDAVGIGEVLRAMRNRDPKAIVIAINDERLAFLQSLSTWPTFGTGWGRRVAEIKAFDLRLVAGRKEDGTVVTSGQAGKGHVPSPNPVAHGAGSAAAGAGAAAGLWGWIELHPAIAVAAALAVIVLGICVYRALKDNAARAQEAPTPGLVPVPELPIVVRTADVDGPLSPRQAANSLIDQRRKEIAIPKLGSPT